MLGIWHRGTRAGLLASASLLAMALGAQAQVIDYANGSDNAGAIVLTNNSTQLQVLTGSATQSGVISDGGSFFGFEKIGAGTLTLSGNNTYLGGTAISAGTLVAGNNDALGSNSSVTISNGATLGISDGVFVNQVLVNGNGKLDVASGQTGMLREIDEIPAGSNLTKTGGGTLVLFSTGVPISGTTAVSAGTFKLGADFILTATSDFVVGSGATLDLGGHSNSILSLGGGGTVTGNGALLFIGDSITVRNTVFSGVLQDGAGGLLLGLDSPGSLTLTGANTYTGGTLICSCSTLRIGDGGTTGSILGNVSDLGSLIFDRSDPYTFAGTINGTGTVSQDGSGVLTLTGSNGYNGGTFINAGTLSITSENALGSGAVTLAGGTTLQLDGSFSNAVTSTTLTNSITLVGDASIGVTNGNIAEISGDISEDSSSRALTKTGAGTLVLSSSNNTYSGGTIISAGTLSITNENALGGGAVTLAGGTMLQLDGSFSNAATSTTLTNSITLVGDASIGVTNGNIAEISGDISEDSSPRALTKTGGGTLILSGTSNYTGATTVNAGTLELTDDLASAPYSDYSVASGATIALDGPGYFDFNTLSGAGGTVQFNNGASLYLGYYGPGGASTFSGTLTGDGDLTVAGTAMLTLNGNVAHSLTNVMLCDCTSIGPVSNPGGLTLHAGVMNVSDTTDVVNGTLTVENGAQWNTDQLYVVSTMVVDAAQVTVTGFTGIGDPFAKPSSLTIQNGGVVQSQGVGAGVDGTISGDAATVSITGSGSQWNVSGGELEIGYYANGAVTVADGGALSAADGLHIYSGGVLNIGSGGLGGTVSAPFYFTNDGQIVADFTDTVTLADNIDGAGSLTKNGSGTLTLSGFNSYSGATSVQGGTLFITASNALPAATDVTVRPGATLKLDDGVDVTINTLSDGAGGGSPASLVLGTSDASTSLTIGGGSGTGTFSGQITGAGSLLFQGGGTMVLAGAGSSIGGELDIGNPSAPGLTGGLTITGSVNSAGTTVVLDGTLSVSGGGMLTSGGTAIVSPFFAAAAPTVIVTGSGSTWNVAGGVSIGDAFGPGPGTVTVADGGTLRITTANLLNIGPDGVLNIGSGGGAGTLDVPGIQNNGQIVANFDTTMDVNLDAGIDGIGALTKDGAGKLTLSGVNGYAGDTDLNGGTLELTNTSSLGLGTLNMAAGTTLLLQSSFGSFSNNVRLTGDPTFNVATGVIMESSGTISDGASAGTLEKIGGGTLILIGTDTYTGATNIAAGTLALSSGGSIADSSVVANAGIFDLSGAGASVSINSLSGAGSVVLGVTNLTLSAANDTFSGVIGGDGSLTIGSGSETLTAYNTYAGSTTVSGGNLTIGDSTHTGAILGALTNSGAVEFVNADLGGMTAITNHGTLNFHNSTSAGNVNITDSGGGTFNFYDTSTAANATINMDGGVPAFHDNSTAGNATITVNGGIPQWLDNSTSGSAHITVDSGIPQWAGNSTAGNATITVNNGIPQFLDNSTAGDATITINGGIPQFLDNSTAGNATIVINGGIVQFIGNADGGSAAFTNDSILDFSNTTGANGDNRISAGSIAGSGSLTIGANQLTVGGNNLDTVYSGGIDGTGGGSLVKVGSGALTLSGSNSYTGATMVSAGTLTVDGSIASSSGVTVQSGATLAGTGTVSGTTIQSGAALTPGDGGTGTLTVNGNLTFQSGSALAEEVSPTGADEVVVNGNASLSGSLFALFAVSGNYGGGGTYTLLTTTGTMSGTFSSFDTLGLPAAYRVDLSYDANDVLLTLTPNLFIWSATPGSSDWSTDANWVYDLTPRPGDTVEFAASSVTQVSITGAVAAGTIQLDSGAPAYSFAITGSSSGAASLTLSGGVTQLTGNNASFTVSGADASHTGTLAFTGSGSAASSILTAGAFGSISFAGNADAGAGAALVAGSGGTVDFSGTTGAAGDHNVTAGSIAGAGTFKLGANTLTVGALGTSTEVSGVISGTGGLTKTGTGALLLSGASTYTGATTVNGGILDVNGSIASTVTFAGGTLKGNGTVGGVNVGGGTLAPGNSIGTLNTGTITFASGSTYQVEVNAAGQSDLINATGLATLNGAVQVLPASGSYGPVTTYRIVNAGSISGTFASISSSLTTLTPSLVYGATSVDLKLVRNDVAFGTAYGTTPNQIAAGGAVSAGGGGTALYTALANAYTPTTIDATLDSMSGEIHASLRSAALEDSRMIRDTVLERLTGGGTGLWAQGFAASGELDGNGNAAELHRNQAGFIAGFDMKLGDSIRAGLAGAYTGQHANLAARASQASSSGGAIIGYAGWQGGAWHVDLGGDYGWSNDSITRGNAALAETESSNSDSQSGQFFARLGYDTSLSGLPVMPYLGLAHVTATSGPFAESGGLAALSGAAKTDSQSYAALGARLTMPDLNLAAMPLALHADLGWSHALEGTTTGQVVSFATGQSFTVLGAPIGSDAATVQLGADLAIAPAAIFSLGYDGSFSSRGASHALRGGLEWRF